jgi:hypothetical protein
MLFKKLSLVFLSAAAIGCQDGSWQGVGSSVFSLPDGKIDLLDVSDDNCLNVEKYIAAVQPKNLPARRVVTKVDFSSYKGQVSENFRLRTAYGNFAVDDKPLNQMEEFTPVAQTKCESVMISDSKGGEMYKVTKATKETLTMTNQWDEHLTYKWVSPTEMTVTHSFIMGDYLCNDKAKARVTVVKNIRWSGDALADTLALKLFSKEFLDLIAQASGAQPETIYVPTDSENIEEDSEPDHRISIPKLKELAGAPVRPDILLCH